MQVSALKTEGLVHHFEVTIPAADLQRQVEAKLTQLAAEIKIPGFRPGKVPLNIVQQRYGSSVLGEVMEDTAQNATAKTMSEKKLRPAAQPKVEFSSIPSGIPADKDLVMKLEVEVIPEIPEVDFSKFSIEKPVAEVSEKEVSESLARIAKANRKPEPQADSYAAKDGDVVTIDFSGKLKGDGDGIEHQRPGLQGEAFPLELGSGRFIPGFEEQLVGVKKGDKRSVKVAFPKDYHAEDLAGKDAVFEVTVQNVSKLTTPEPNEEMAKEAGFDTLEALKKEVEQQIGKNFGQVSRNVAKRRLMDKLAESQKFPVPPTLAENEFTSLWQQVEAAKKAGQLEEEDKGKSDEQLKKEYRTIAERRVRLGLLLSEFARKNKIEVGREEMRQAMFVEAQRYPGQEKQVIEFFAKNPQAREQLTAPILEEKVADFILSKVQIKEKKVSREELQKAAEE